MTRFVLFDGAPTIEQCYSSLGTNAAPAGAWHTFTVELSPSPPPHQSTSRSSPFTPEIAAQGLGTPPAAKNKRRRSSPGSQQNPWDVTTSQFDDADEPHEVGVPPKEAAAVPSSDDEPDSLEMERRKVRRRSSSSPEVEPEQEDEDDGTSRISFMMPPPTQTRSRYSSVYRMQQSQPAFQPPHDVSFPFPPPAPLPDVSRAMTSYTADDSYDATYADGASLGAPPHFGWKVYNLSALDQLRKRLAKAKGASTKVSVLAAVNSFERRETRAGFVAEVTLIDDSGQHVKLVLWKAAGVEIAKVIRPGDIVYVESVTLKEYNNALQLTFSDRDSQLGICWRTHILDEDDELYRFHVGWRESIAEAEEVLKQAEWFARRMG
ncbi:hypothetical protein JCM10449v2_001904 [Rhodotorula kratochvilovae]